ncbi:MAG: putative baseplate assembly protein [Rhizobiaceae bacterium]
MLPRVSLADLSAEDLSAEMVRRIEAHTPEWKNVQPGDPGRTLIDLFAWMGETILYRANLTPRRMRLEFLNLLNLKQRPAEPARGMLQLLPKVPSKARPTFVASGTRANGLVPFEVLSAATVQPFEGAAFIKRRLGEAERADLAEVLASLTDVYGVTLAEPYATERLFGPGDMARENGTDPLADSIDQTLWIGLFCGDASAAARAAAIAALDAQPCLLNIGVIPRLSLPDLETPPPAGIDWSIATRGAEPGEVAYLDLAIDDDRTRGLTAEGTLRLVLPRADMVYAPPNDLASEIDAGVGNRPPRLDDPALAARLIGWLRLHSPDPAARLPLSWAGINSVMVDQRETHAGISLGVASGQAGQRFRLPGRDIDAESVVLSVAEPGGQFLPWDAVSDLGAAGRDDRVFELEAEAGEVMFGDGLTGRLLPAGARVRLDRLRAGGGVAGNLGPGSLTKIEMPGLLAHQPAAFHGGVAAETLEAAEKRVGAMLSHRNRCITEDDYRAIAAELGLARVEVLPGFRPYQRRGGSPGVVSIMVLPDQVLRRAPNPRADRRILEQVHAHLDPRRPLATELYVISPDYRGIGLTIGITLREGFAREEVVRAVKERMFSVLWPLAGGGMDSAGWTLGAQVRSLELQVEAARVPGVATVLGVNLFAASNTGLTLLPRQPGSMAQNLTLDEWQLPELLAIDVSSDGSMPATTLSLSQSSTGTGAIGVPVVPEVC